MMEEVFMMMATDDQVIEQMSEEEILASLVAETGPAFTVPTKKAKLKESRLQIMDDDALLDKYQKENHQLQQASLRLEQENDNLAHKLISSKIALRTSLDRAEDRVDELTKDLLQTRRRLQATEEEKQGKEEEGAMLKEVFRRELEKFEEKVKRSSGIIADYKQICSQLAHRLEKQEATHRVEVDLLKSAIRACPRCQHAVDSDEASNAGETAAPTEDAGTAEQSSKENKGGLRQAQQRREDREKESLRAQIRALERDLAETKLQMVEAKCKIQELEHQKGTLANDLQDAKNNWISKAFTSLRTSSGGLHSIGLPRHEAPTVGWNLHRGALSGLSTKKLLWPHKHSREDA